MNPSWAPWTSSQESEEAIHIPSTGEMVKVIDGPFNGSTRCEEINDEKKKLKVM